MVRGAKTPMEFIKDRKARVSTFLTRRKGLEKKSHELSILCGVQVGLIIFAPEDISSRKINNKEPLLYSKDHEEVNNIIHSFLASDPIERKRRSTDLSGFYLDKTKKARDELNKLKKDNIESLYPTWDQTYNNLSAEQLRHLADQLETNIQAAKARLEFMKRARNLGLTACGSNMNLYEGGRLALTGNDHLSTWPVPNMSGWNSMQVDAIDEPHEIISQQEGGVLCLPPIENAMADNPGSMWTREDDSNSNANIKFNTMDLETNVRYASSSNSNHLFNMDMESEVERFNMMTPGFLENQHDNYFLLPSTGTTQWHAPSHTETEIGKHNMIADFTESIDMGIFENEHDHYFLLPPMETMEY